MTQAPRLFRVTSRVVAVANMLPFLWLLWVLLDLGRTILISDWSNSSSERAFATFGLIWFVPGTLILLGHLRACLPSSRLYVFCLWFSTLIFNALLIPVTLTIPSWQSRFSIWQGITCAVSMLMIVLLPILKSSEP
jgi:hypothetical protein